MRGDLRLEILELPGELKELVGACEVTGNRTIFERSGRAVAILVSYDEYLALAETIDVNADITLRERIEKADDEARRGALLEMEDLVVE